MCQVRKQHRSSRRQAVLEPSRDSTPLFQFSLGFCLDGRYLASGMKVADLEKLMLVKGCGPIMPGA